MDERIFMKVFVKIEETLELKSPFGGIVMIFFNGTIDCDYFHGTIMPGAVDTQFTDIHNNTRMSARYMAKGTDKRGNVCTLFIENEGWFKDGLSMPFQTEPKFWTDNNELAEYVKRNRIRGVGNFGEAGLEIDFFVFES